MVRRAYNAEHKKKGQSSGLLFKKPGLKFTHANVRGGTKSEESDTSFSRGMSLLAFRAIRRVSFPGWQALAPDQPTFFLGGYFVARINVEDKLHADPRFKRLTRRLGNEDQALGLLVRFWSVAQRHWIKEELVPERDFIADGFEILFELGFAEPHEDGFYAKGARREFEWLRGNSKGGKSSAQTRIEKYGTAIPFNARNRSKTEVTSKSTEVSTEPLSLSLSPSPSQKIYSVGERASHASVKKGKVLKSRDAGQVVTAYCDAFKSRYGTRPELSGKAIGILNRMAKDFGSDRASDICQCYLQMNDHWFETRCHDVETLWCNVTKVAASLDRGVQNLALEVKLEKALGRNDDGIRIQGGNQEAVRAVRKPDVHEGTAGGILGPYPVHAEQMDGRKGHAVDSGEVGAAEEPICGRSEEV